MMLLLPLLTACDHAPPVDVQALQGACVALQGKHRYLAPEGDSFAWTARDLASAAHFRLQAADLGTYLLVDAEGRYLSSEDGPLLRPDHLESDMTRLEDRYISGGEWTLEPASGGRVTLFNRRNSAWLGRKDLVDTERKAEPVTLVPAEGCASFPEMSLDAEGSITRTHWEDGDLYGIVDAHSHVLSNLGFGGFMFHGAAFHRLGVEHALPACTDVHGEQGRRDIFGYVFDMDGNNAASLFSVLADVADGELSEDNHATDGWPTFSDWPDATNRSTHQSQYYRWLERAWLGGLRLEVLHATTNSIICKLAVGEGFNPARYDCEDMTSVDRILEEAWEMQDYIDAQHGGAGKGWFRIVGSAAEARAVIGEGKLAVVLGIETSDLFDCKLTPLEGGPVCDAAFLRSQVDRYHAKGVRAIFPVHKYDNAFTPGDGSSDFIELGNFFNSGHWTNLTDQCPPRADKGFDGGPVSFRGILQPREDYLSPAPLDFSAFATDPLQTAFPYAGALLEGSLDGDYCQNGTLTDMGELLFAELMSRGMIIELDHLPAWSYLRALEILEAADYPAAGTHGRNAEGRLYALGGVNTIGLGVCQDPANPGATLQGYLAQVALAEEKGGYPGLGFGFDLNGFAGARGPRFGERGCSSPQEKPVEYPFSSYAADVTFTEPFVGTRPVDFNTEGMIHIGMLPELIEDARHDAGDDSRLEPLFRSAEGYVRMWEKAESRAGG
jgi:microsomal dipeptidase-like Zn-dependent dipeptidase